MHIANIAGFNGFDWLSAPLKWQLLDVVYLVLDIAVVAGVVFHTGPRRVKAAIRGRTHVSPDHKAKLN